MKAKLLPKKLGKEPLIDVVFGVNFVSDVHADALLPGLLMAKLTGKQLKFETFPVAQLPQSIRETEPNLRNAPLMRVVVDEQFSILIASKWLGVGCQMPYAGWTAFKQMIETAFAVLKDAPFVLGIERHSLKYVDLIESQGNTESLSRFNLQIEIAGRKLTDQVTQLRTELLEAPFLHAATILSPASVTRADGVTLSGAVADVDTHRVENFSVIDFLERLPQLLEDIHTANKVFFFELLSDSTLREMEPQYD